MNTLTDEQRSIYAEYLRERIYGTITLLAVVTPLWRHADSYTAWGSLWIVLGTVGALYLATVVADHMSQQIVHGVEKKKAQKPFWMRTPASGLIEPAGAPTFFIILAILGIIQLSTALLIGIILLVVSLFMFSVLSGRKVTNSATRILTYSAFQVAIGLAIVFLKVSIE